MCFQIKVLGASICVLGLYTIPNYEVFILGNVFLRDYYSIWDMDNNVLGLTPSILSKVSPIKTSPINPSSQQIETQNKVFLIIIGVFQDVFYTIADLPFWPMLLTVSLLICLVGLPICMCALFCKFIPGVFGTQLVKKEAEFPEIRIINIYEK